MTRFYVMSGLILLSLILRFYLVYKRFKKEGDDFKLHRPNSWKRLEDYLPWVLIGFGVNLIDGSPIETYLIDSGYSVFLITLIEISIAVLLSLFALFGFNIYLKLIGWDNSKSGKV